MHRRRHHRPGRFMPHADEAHRLLSRQRMHQWRELATDDAEGERNLLRRQDAHKGLAPVNRSTGSVLRGEAGGAHDRAPAVVVRLDAACEFLGRLVHRLQPVGGEGGDEVRRLQSLSHQVLRL